MGWRNAAFRHIDAAIGSVEEAARFRGREAGSTARAQELRKAPRYLACTQRFARAQYLLRVEEEPNVTRRTARCGPRCGRRHGGDRQRGGLWIARIWTIIARGTRGSTAGPLLEDHMALPQERPADIAGEEDNRRPRGGGTSRFGTSTMQWIR